jgi:hypothetical protein
LAHDRTTVLVVVVAAGSFALVYGSMGNPLRFLFLFLLSNALFFALLCLDKHRVRGGGGFFLGLFGFARLHLLFFLRLFVLSQFLIV